MYGRRIVRFIRCCEFIRCCKSCAASQPPLRQFIELYEKVDDEIDIDIDLGFDADSTRCMCVISHPDFVRGVIDHSICDPQKFWNFVNAELLGCCNFVQTDERMQSSLQLLLNAGCQPPANFMVRMAERRMLECVALLHDRGIEFDGSCWNAAVRSFGHTTTASKHEYLRELLKRTGFCATIENTLDDLSSEQFIVTFIDRLAIVRDVLQLPIERTDVAWRILFKHVDSLQFGFIVPADAVRYAAAALVDLGCPLPPGVDHMRSTLLSMIRLITFVPHGETTEAEKATAKEEMIAGEEMIAKVRDYLNPK